MKQRLTDRFVSSLPAPAKGQTICWDQPNFKGGDWTPGFGIRVTTAGYRSFVLMYRRNGRQRLMTIGNVPAWNVTSARAQAAELRRAIDLGTDPLAEQEADRNAPTVADLVARFETDEIPKKREKTQRDYRGILKRHILPALGRRKVNEIVHSDIDALHRKISATAPYAANRVLAVLSRMLSLAIKWGMRADNPAKGIERAPEEKRARYLSPSEITRLSEALAARPGSSANAIRLLLLTGARRGEVLSATWSQFDLANGVWVKPSSQTKQKREHRVPLSAPALALLTEIRETSREAATAHADSPFLFPNANGRPQGDLKCFWAAVTKVARIEDARVHDLRHTYASVLASSGLSLPIIGALLGHTQASTTHRYSHLMDDPLRAATERAGAIITGGEGAEVVPMPKRKA